MKPCISQAAADAQPSGMVSVIGLDSAKVQELVDAANAEVAEAERVQIANFLCNVSITLPNFNLPFPLKMKRNFGYYFLIYGFWSSKA